MTKIFNAGVSLPQMLVCSWKDSLPTIHTVPFDQGNEIPDQAKQNLMAHGEQNHPHAEEGFNGGRTISAASLTTDESPGANFARKTGG